MRTPVCSTALLTTILLSCAAPTSPPPEETFTVGPEGGRVVAQGGDVVLEFPPGALTEPTAITVERVDSFVPHNALVGPVYEFAPHKINFGQPVRVILKYDPDELPENVAVHQIILHYFDGAWQVDPDIVVDTVNHTVSSSAAHFNRRARAVTEAGCTELDRPSCGGSSPRNAYFQFSGTIAQWDGSAGAEAWALDVAAGGQPAARSGINTAGQFIMRLNDRALGPQLRRVADEVGPALSVTPSDARWFILTPQKLLLARDESIVGNLLYLNTPPDQGALPVGGLLIMPVFVAQDVTLDGTFNVGPVMVRASQLLLPAGWHTLQALVVSPAEVQLQLGNAEGVSGALLYLQSAANLPPLAVNDQAGTSVNTPVTIDVLANDSDPEQHALSVLSVDPPASGSATVLEDNTVRYVPATDFIGTDAFAYQVQDAAGGISSALITVTVQ